LSPTPLNKPGDIVVALVDEEPTVNTLRMDERAATFWKQPTQTALTDLGKR